MIFDFIIKKNIYIIQKYKKGRYYTNKYNKVKMLYSQKLTTISFNLNF